MARSQKANTQSSRLKVITHGDTSKAFSLPESGATVIFTAAASATRTITLPAVAGVPGSKGVYFRFVFGVAEDAASTVIQTSAAAELFKGRVIFYDSNSADVTKAMVQTGASTQYPDLSNDRILTLAANIEPGTMIDCTSDGSHWYITGQHIATLRHVFS